MQHIKQGSCGIWGLRFPCVINCIPFLINCALCLQYPDSIMCCLWVKFPTWNCYGWEGRSITHTCVCVHVCAYSLTFGVAGVESSFSLVWIHFASVEGTERSYAAIFCERQLNILFIASLEGDHASQGPSAVLTAPEYCSAKLWRGLIGWKDFRKRVIVEKQKQKRPPNLKTFELVRKQGQEGQSFILRL